MLRRIRTVLEVARAVILARLLGQQLRLTQRLQRWQVGVRRMFAGRSSTAFLGALVLLELVWRLHGRLFDRGRVLLHNRAQLAVTVVAVHVVQVVQRVQRCTSEQVMVNLVVTGVDHVAIRVLLLLTGGCRVVTVLLVHLGQTLHPQHFRRLQQGAQLALRHVHFALVHEVDNSLEFVEFHVFQDDDRMFARIGEEQFFEVVRTGAQDHFVCFDRVTIARERHIDEAVVVEHFAECFGHVMCVVVPFQAELLRGWYGYASGAIYGPVRGHRSGCCGQKATRAVR